MLGSTPKGEPLGRAALRVAGLDAGRHALLLEMLAALARAQEPEAKPRHDFLDACAE